MTENVGLLLQGPAKTKLQQKSDHIGRGYTAAVIIAKRIMVKNDFRELSVLMEISFARILACFQG